MRRAYNQGVIPLRVRAELALHAVNGLAYLHEMHVVHFDLKPDNLLLDGPLILGGYAGAHPVPMLKVADFGLSKHKWSNYVSGVKDLRCCSFSPCDALHMCLQRLLIILSFPGDRVSGHVMCPGSED